MIAIARLIAAAHGDERTQGSTRLLFPTAGVKFPDQLEHVIERGASAGVDRRAVVKAGHAEVRLIVERLAARDADADAKFGGERNEHAMT